ncbi:uncharacterized protein LOC103704915 [Phoenix dactylifera]|uniref:Uncharacterized protein LOC103704915 n=1 Tax=Phoenix dactylifera TaxID=42345 RepID=A0A8B7BW55_PHODC|nr:uncharacterized protein LOC103704915 [Phoenix dactylifera]
MPRKKVVLQPHPTEQARMQCYLTRRNGIKKKVRELSILCDAEIVHIAIPPTGEPSLVLGEHTNLLAILDRFANIDPLIRERRRRQVIDCLKNSYKKKGHEISTDSLLQYNMSGSEEVEECCNRIRELQEKIDAVNRNLSHWRNPGAIDDIFEIIVKEEILHNSLQLVREQKARLEQRNGAPDSTALEVPSFAFTQHTNPQPVRGALCQELPQRDPAHQNASGGPVGIGAGFNLPPYRQIIQNSLGHENPTNLEALLSEYLVNPNHPLSNEVSNNLLPQRVSSFPGMSNVLIVDSITDSSFHPQRQITQSTTNHEFPASTEARREERFGVSNSNACEVPCFDFAPISSQPLEGILNQVPPDRDVALPPLPEVFVEAADNGAGFNLHQHDQTAQSLLCHVYPTNLEASLSANLADPSHQLSTDVSDNLLFQRVSNFPSISNELHTDRLTGSNFYSQRLMADSTTSHEFPATSETWGLINMDRPWEGVLNYVPFQQEPNLPGPSQWENTNMQGLGRIKSCNRDFNFGSSPGYSWLPWP